MKAYVEVPSWRRFPDNKSQREKLIVEGAHSAIGARPIRGAAGDWSARKRRLIKRKGTGRQRKRK